MYIEALLENEDVKQMANDNSDLLTETTALVSEFPTILKSFVMQNAADFIGENIEDTRKNIRVFSEVATSQLLAEVSNLSASIMMENEVVEEVVEENVAPAEPKIDDYL